MQAEKGAASPIDSAYAGEVSKFFNEKRRLAELTDAEDTSLFDHENFVAMQQMSLEKLANPKTAREMKPRDAALALADLAGTMAGRNLEIEANVTGDPAIDQASEAEHAQAKKIFMDSCEKLYPNVTVDKKDFGNDLKRTVDGLSQAAVAPLPPDISGEELDRMAEERPQELAKRLDTILHDTGDALQDRSRISFDVEDEQRRKEAGGHLAAGTEMFYKLQLFRDELQERMYGRKDVTKSEAEAIDKMRNAFSGENAEGGQPDEGKEKPAEMTGKEKETGLAVDSAVEQEEKQLEEAEKEGKSVLRTVGPASEALQGIWKKDKALVGRLDLLAERIDNMTKLKLQADQQIEPSFAYRLSMRQIFGELLPAESDALKAAARQESERRHKLAEEKGDKDLEKPVSAERLFIDLMSVLVRDGKK
jgi:hypothetical protein